MRLLENETVIGTGKALYNGQEITVDITYGNTVSLPDGKRYSLKLNQYEQLLEEFLARCSETKESCGDVPSPVPSPEPEAEDEDTPFLTSSTRWKLEPPEETGDPAPLEETDEQEDDSGEMPEHAGFLINISRVINSIALPALLIAQTVTLLVLALIVLGIIPVGLLDR